MRRPYLPFLELFLSLLLRLVELGRPVPAACRLRLVLLARTVVAELRLLPAVEGR